MKIVVVPFRDRAPQLRALLPFLAKHFDRIVVAEQAPGKPFNRGAIKHAGVQFAAAAPETTLYFHDVDLLPGPRFPGSPIILPESPRVVHLYGHRHCLGGIVGINARNYDEIGGFDTDRWVWGGEDTALQAKVLAAGLKIDRSGFTLRYQNDAAVRELDSEGVPMRGAEARRRFIAEYEKRERADQGAAEAPEALKLHSTGPLHSPKSGLYHGIFA